MTASEELVAQLVECVEQLTLLQERRRNLARELTDSIGASDAARAVGVPRQTLVDWLGRDYQRKKSEPPLMPLVRAGLLFVGEELIINRRRQPSAIGIVDPDGRIVVDGEAFDAPSTACQRALRSGPQDGWTRWRVPRLDGITLSQLRESLAAG